METVVVQQFLDLFQDFLNLCQLENWPNNDTTEVEIRNAFLVAQHIEKCMDRLQKKGLIYEFLSTLNNNQEVPSSLLKNCFADPSKYVLKRIIHANTKIIQMDIGFKIFLEMHSEEKLEKCLTGFMLEAASKETLLRNLSTEIPEQKLLDFKTQLFLCELNMSNDSKQAVVGMLKNCKQNTFNLLIKCLLNKELKHRNSVQIIVDAFIDVMLKKNHGDKLFWKSLFNIEEKCFIELCTTHSDVFKIICQALFDSGKLLRENMSSEYFYIDLTYLQLVSIVQRICNDECLKMDFYDSVLDKNADLNFWENMICKSSNV